MAQCAFGRAITNGAWDARFPFGTDLDGRFLYTRDGERQWLLAISDFSYACRCLAREAESVTRAESLRLIPTLT